MCIRDRPKSDNRTAIFDDKYLVGSSFKLNQREARIPSVSYTHLDVYKRQGLYHELADKRITELIRDSDGFRYTLMKIDNADDHHRWNGGTRHNTAGEQPAGNCSD